VIFVIRIIVLDLLGEKVIEKLSKNDVVCWCSVSKEHQCKCRDKYYNY